MKIRSIIGLVVSLALLAILIKSFYFRQPIEYRSDQFLMDTLVSIRVYGHDEVKLREAVRQAYAEMHRIADLTDRFPEPGTSAYAASDVCRVNGMAGKRPVSVDSNVFELLNRGKKYHDATDGAINVTIGPVMDQWAFGSNSPHVPSNKQITSLLSLVDNASLTLDQAKKNVFLKKPGMKLDLGALAKGYATEQAVQVLKKQGIEKALIDAGGNIRVIGTNNEDRPWRIGIKDPRKPGEIIAVVALEDSAAVTSGDYYRCFESGGKRWHHILDPKTGYPSTKNISVTVIASDAGLADGLSTALFVLEANKALTIARKLGVDVLIVKADGQIMHTPGIASKLTLLDKGNRRSDQGR